MGTSRVELAKIIDGDANLKQGYEALFGALPDLENWPETGKPTADPESEDMMRWESLSEEQQNQATTLLVNLAKAIAAFEETILPPSAPIAALRAARRPRA